MSRRPITITVVPLENHDRLLPLPRHETDGAAGLDIRACLIESERETGLALPQRGRVLVPTGLSLAIPEGFEGQLRPRSGLAARHGITLLNSPGTIDSDYRGELRVILVNLGSETFRIKHGERIAQLVIAPYQRSDLRIAPKLDASNRGQDGFGSTGRG